MIKKLSLVLLASFGLNILSAHAATQDGFYMTGQLGYAQTHMANITNVNQLAPTQPNDNKITVDGKNNMANNGLSGRFAVGYQFNSNFALEMGYLQLRQGKTGTIVVLSPENEEIAQGNLILSQHAFDIAAKGIIPLTYNFNLYAKLGVAYLSSAVDFNIQTVTDETLNKKFDVNENIGLKKSEWAPEAAIGVSYDITPNVSIDTSWTHIHTIGKQRAGNVDFFAAGLTYNFG